MEHEGEPPAFLPGPTSRKWHSRRWWDSLGYVRVRSLANPNWPRNADWLRNVIESDADREDCGAVEVLLRQAAAAARRYPRTAGGRVDAEASWRELLAAIDVALEARQREHLDAVRRAGRSGT